MKNVIIHKFDPLIYPRYVYISIGANIKTIKKYFEISALDEEYFINNYKSDRAIGFKVIDIKTQDEGILMNFKATKIEVSTIAHESVHIADYIFEEIGAYAQSFSDKNEQYAYLVGWIAECIWLVKTKKLNG